MLTWITACVVAGIVFAVLDFFWLGKIGRPLYQARMGELIAERPNKLAAVIFYLVFLLGITHFVTYPALISGSWLGALGVGALFGLVTYSTWNFTNLATLKDFPASIVPIDLAWGISLSALTSVSTYVIVQVLPWAAG